MRLFLAAVWLVVPLMTCEVNPQGGRPAQLRVVTVPDTADVLVEGRFVGTGRTLAQRPALVRAGTHHITVQARGYFPHDLELDLPVGETTARVALRPVPP